MKKCNEQYTTQLLRPNMDVPMPKQKEQKIIWNCCINNENKSIFYRKHHPSKGKRLSKGYFPLSHIGLEH